MLAAVRALSGAAQRQYGLLHLGAFKKLFRTAQLIRDTRRAQGRLDHRRLCVRAEQHRDLAGGHTVLVH